MLTSILHKFDCRIYFVLVSFTHNSSLFCYSIIPRNIHSDIFQHHPGNITLNVANIEAPKYITENIKTILFCFSIILGTWILDYFFQYNPGNKNTILFCLVSSWEHKYYSVNPSWRDLKTGFYKRQVEYLCRSCVVLDIRYKTHGS